MLIFISSTVDDPSSLNEINIIITLFDTFDDN